MGKLDLQELRTGDGGPSEAMAKPVHLTLPLGHLCHVPRATLLALKMHAITKCDQFLAAVGRYEERQRFSRATGISPTELTILARRADLARVRGLGWVFRSMVEHLEVADVAALARNESVSLHERLQTHNRVFNVARRSPTLSEVTDWIAQAQRLPRLVTYVPQRQKDVDEVACRNIRSA